MKGLLDNKKIWAIIIVAFAVIIIYISMWHVSCNIKRQSNSYVADTDMITLKYKDTINGLEVKVFWKPNKIQNSYVIGPAIIEFRNVHNETSSTVVNNNFGISRDKLADLIKTKPIQGGSERYNIRSADAKPIFLEYEKFKPKSTQISFHDAPDEPFFFYDLDFDGSKELLVAEIFQGQRWCNKLKAYKLDEDQDYFVLEDDFLQITYDEPYIDLDENSIICPLSKTLIIYKSGGVGNSEWRIYKYKPNNQFEDPKYTLERIDNSLPFNAENE
jgi:hypothetical protein